MGRTWVETVLAIGLGSVALMINFPVAAMTAAEYRTLGLQYRQQEQFAEAIAALEKAVELEPKNLDGRVLLGWTQHQAKQGEAAAETLWQVIFEDPYKVTAFNAVGIVHLVSGDLLPALLTHIWAATLKPDNEIAYYNLSLTCQRLELYDCSIATALQAGKLEPSNPHPLVALALAHWSKGDRPAARQAYQQALALDGRYGGVGFLAYLTEAGFSLDQVKTTEQILAMTLN